jgi:hypothetical protein
LRLGKTVGQLLNEISSAELTEWMAYLQVEQERGQPDPADVWKKAFKADG